ncbi:cell division cycle protein 16 [Sesbania bispinosa]|nr:cell division cycle protein 16 [Sesbania bispinosa]
MTSTSQTSPFHSGGGRSFSRMHNLNRRQLLLSLVQFFHQPRISQLEFPDLIFSCSKLILNSTLNEGDGERPFSELEGFKSKLQTKLLRMEY